MVPFIDPRHSRGLTRAARRFVFSMMHEHIRTGDPDYERVHLAIFQFGATEDGVRSPILHTDKNVKLIALTELEAMISATYALWQEICQERELEVRRRAGGSRGPLL